MTYLLTEILAKVSIFDQKHKSESQIILARNSQQILHWIILLFELFLMNNIDDNCEKMRKLYKIIVG